MSHRIFQNPDTLTHDEAEEAFRSTDTMDVCNAIVQASLYDDDFEWVQKWCLDLSRSDDNNIKAISATCLGHLARRFGELDAETVVPVIQRLNNIPEISGWVETAIDDIVQFLGWDRSLLV